MANLHMGRLQATPAVQTAMAIQSTVNLRKESLHLVPANENGHVLSWKLDALEDCTVRIYFLASEKLQDKNETLTFESETTPAQYNMKKGIDQAFTQPVADALHLADRKPEELESTAGQYPLVIVVSANTDDDNVLGSKRKSVDTQITYARFVKAADNTFSLKVFKVKIKYNNKYYVVHEIYGVIKEMMTKRLLKDENALFA